VQLPQLNVQIRLKAQQLNVKLFVHRLTI